MSFTSQTVLDCASGLRCLVCAVWRHPTVCATNIAASRALHGCASYAYCLFAPLCAGLGRLVCAVWLVLYGVALLFAPPTQLRAAH